MSDAPVIPDWAVAFMDFADREVGPMLAGGASSLEAPTPGSTPLPALQIFLVDGSADQTSGYAVVDVHAFANDYLEASALARTFDSKVMGYPHLVSSNGSAVLFDQVECLSIPAEIPWLDDNSVRRIKSTYTVSFRRR
jgi:hypothetical protein